MCLVQVYAIPRFWTSETKPSANHWVLWVKARRPTVVDRFRSSGFGQARGRSSSRSRFGHVLTHSHLLYWGIHTNTIKSCLAMSSDRLFGGSPHPSPSLFSAVVQAGDQINPLHPRSALGERILFFFVFPWIHSTCSLFSPVHQTNPSHTSLVRLWVSPPGPGRVCFDRQSCPSPILTVLADQPRPASCCSIHRS